MRVFVILTYMVSGLHVYGLLINVVVVATIWYLGHGQEGTGNWCFQDGGVISFRDILSVYNAHFHGRKLTVVTDCPFSGTWCGAANEELDSLAIPACGHKVVERGMLLKVVASCKGDDIAHDMWFSTYCILVRINGLLWFLGRKGDNKQRPQLFDFIM